MPSVLPMAALTILLTTGLCISVLNAFSGHKSRYNGLLLVGLPFSVAINRLVKIPLLEWIANAAGIPLAANAHTPLWLLVVILFNAPVWEEAIKALPLLIPGLRRFLSRPADALWAGLALGMGFGLGEAVYLAYGLATSAQFSSLPWYAFTGFAGERLIMTIGHGLMTAQIALGLQKQGWYALRGYLIAIGLHALINLGAILAALRFVSPQTGSLFSYAGVLVALLLFGFQLRSSQRPKSEIRLPNETVLFEKHQQ